jgi:zinc D-Ala-D-Ala dipeptidase
MSFEYVDLSDLPFIKIDLRYASLNNFMNEDVYGAFNKAYLHRVAADKLSKATHFLQLQKPGFKFLILDALRPRSAQRKLFAKVKDTPQEKYVANPDKGSVHNFGFAVDLTVIDPSEKELDMGSGFDDFRPLSEPSKEEMFLSEGLLSQLHINNRRLLRSSMEQGGFLSIPHEWWHFNALTIDEVRKNFAIVEEPW